MPNAAVWSTESGDAAAHRIWTIKRVLGRSRELERDARAVSRRFQKTLIDRCQIGDCSGRDIYPSLAKTKRTSRDTEGRVVRATRVRRRAVGCEESAERERERELRTRCVRPRSTFSETLSRSCATHIGERPGEEKTERNSLGTRAFFPSQKPHRQFRRNSQAARTGAARRT